MGIQLARFWLWLFWLVVIYTVVAAGAVVLVGLWVRCKFWFDEHHYHPGIPECSRCGWTDTAKTGS